MKRKYITAVLFFAALLFNGNHIVMAEEIPPGIGPVSGPPAQENGFSGDTTYAGDDGSGQDAGQTDGTSEAGEPDMEDPFGEKDTSVLDSYKERSEPVIIDTLETTVEVSEDNRYHVIHNIKVCYLGDEGHVLKAAIPLYNLKATDTDEVTEINVKSNRELTTNRNVFSKDGYEVTIEDKTRGQAVAEYVLDYMYTSRGDDDSTCDILQVTVAGFKNIPVMNASFSVTMPKAFGINGTNFTTENGEKINIPLYSDNLTLTGRHESELKGGVLKMGIAVEEGYFNSTSSSGLVKNIMMGTRIAGWIAIAVFMFMAFRIYMKSGKSEKSEIKEQMEKIEEMNGVEAAAVAHGRMTTEDIMLYALELAEEGYIKIRDTSYRHQKNRDPVKSYRFIKEKEYDGEDEYQETFMRLLFKKKDVISPEEINESVLIKAKINHLRMDIQEDGVNELYKTDRGKEKFCAAMSLLIPVVFNILFGIQNLTAGFGIHTFSIPIGILVSLFLYLIIRKTDRAIKAKNMTGGGVTDSMMKIYMLTCMLFCLIFTGILNTKIFLYDPAVMTGIYLVEEVFVFLSCNLRKRTEECVELNGKIKGLKKYLKEADETQIAANIKRNPDYVYGILPTAIATGAATDAWLAKMDGCLDKKPEWYESDSDSEFRLAEFVKDWASIKKAAGTGGT